MQTDYLIDLSPLSGTVHVEVEAETALPPELIAYLETNIRSTAALVSAQGLSAGAGGARMEVVRLGASSNKRSVSAELSCAAVPASAWRVLAGLLSAFDMASATLVRVAFRQDGYTGAPLPESKVLAHPYPSAATPSFPLNRRQRSRHAASLEVELVDPVDHQVRDAVVQALNAWLRTCVGGFFEDGQPPISNAHDCPRINEVAPTLLAARFDIWTGNEAAFEAALNLLEDAHRRHGCIRGVKMY